MLKYSIPFIVMFLTFNIYPQFNLEQALKKGGWTGGIAGTIGWENYKNKISTIAGDVMSDVDGFNFIFSSRNGSIVETNGVFGFDFQWRENNRTAIPDPNPSNEKVYFSEKLWFLGLWARYYIPLGGNFALFPEGSAGYAAFKFTEEVNNITGNFINSTQSADGFAYNLGFGFSHFVTQNAAFEITGRWENGSLNGETENIDGSTNDLNVNLGNFNILFGFQIYLK